MGERVVPILPSRDLAETLAFYARLGFENRGAPPEDWDYLIVGRGGLEVHFIAAPDLDPGASRGSCFLFVDDADALHEEWRAAGLDRLEQPMDTEYGMREFEVFDPSGNRVRAGSQRRN